MILSGEVILNHCSICGYETAYKSNFTRHQKIHEKRNNVPPVDDTVCPYCSKNFTNKYNCARHVKERCPNRPTAPNVALPPENVAPPAPNVAPPAPNVALPAPNVALPAPNVAPPAPNVAPPSDTESSETSSFKCDVCLKDFVKRWNLLRHAQHCRGTPHPHMCTKCHKILGSRAGKSKHMKKCDGTGNETALVLADGDIERNTELQEITPINPSSTIAGSSTINQVHSCDTVNINNQNTQNNVNVNIHINNFGHEDMSHITPEMLDIRLQELNGKGIYNMIKAIHFNPEKPQNHNIRLGSRKRKTVRIKENDRWHIKADSDIAEILMTKYKSMLVQRSFTPEFKAKLKHETDLLLIQQDLIKFNKQTNLSAYYQCVRKLVALIEDLEALILGQEPPTPETTTSIADQ